ncbi:MAG: FIST N-terminal domain-containing protein [archaeon]
MVQKTASKNIYVGSGISKEDDPFKAGKASAEMALKELNGIKPTFGLVFCSGSKYGKNDKTAEDLAKGVASALSNVPWAGCTTAGEIYNGRLESMSCTCLLISSEFMQVGIGVGKGVHKDAKHAGKTAAEKALENIKLERVVNPYLKFTAQKTKNAKELIKMYDYSFLLFSSGITLEHTGMEDQVIKGMQQVLGKQYPIIGGTSADDFRMLTNYQFANGEFFSDSAVAVAISTGLRCGFGYDHGYVPTGKTTLVTKSEGYLVHELDNKKALERYAELLEIKPNELWDSKSKFFTKNMSLAGIASKYFSMTINPKMIPFLSTVTINPFGVVDVNGNIAIRIAKGVVGDSVEFTQEIPPNIILSALKIDPKKVLDAEKNALQQAVDEADANPAIVFIFDCELRKIYTGEDKIQEAISGLGKKYPNARIFGFNTMGEYTFSRTSEQNAGSATVSVGVISNKLVSE